MIRIRLPAGLTGALLACLALPAWSLDIPLSADRWEVLGYSRIPVNEVTFADGAMIVSVADSASAIVHPLVPGARFRTLHVRATIQGEINLDGRRQGEKGADDFRLRVGLVYAGEKTLNFLQRSIAPNWVKTLYALAPEGAGISRVEFYNTWQDPQLEGRERPHPATDIWREHFILETGEDGVVDQSVTVPTDTEVVAIWISTDGDDTGSVFSVRIESLTLDPA